MFILKKIAASKIRRSRSIFYRASESMLHNNVDSLHRISSDKLCGKNKHKFKICNVSLFESVRFYVHSFSYDIYYRSELSRYGNPSTNYFVDSCGSLTVKHQCIPWHVFDVSENVWVILGIELQGKGNKQPSLPLIANWLLQRCAHFMVRIG